MHNKLTIISTEYDQEIMVHYIIMVHVFITIATDSSSMHIIPSKLEVHLVAG